MLQLAQATAILANNGVKHKPQVVIATQDAMTRERVPVAPASRRWTWAYKPSNLAIVRKARWWR